MLTKFLHTTSADVSGRMNAVAECGRLVGRLSLTSAEQATCPKCIAKSAERVAAVALTSENK